eukprot:Plantae.Rhodophyta-Purpureofilum_apyrenoidigerum.ctg13712.p1 GENE.Plantae.Rhodophyta-Purpureofilum_apyrenoidigerum.ctg13712~~Plantae.Rhodophyta-Purpureofilum_apyrenoidigerum.ctg13712.p1  ORF type:complete len:294 (-),score=49.36 Plantae.Rhodophyta-Purpureofilum_apyrenoidigerum.ctg13712:438-1319(-)
MEEATAEYEIMCVLRPAVRLQDHHIRVDLSSEYNRRRHPNGNVEKDIAARWDAKVAAKGATAIWNATKFRLHSLSLESNERNDVLVTLRLGVTDYREYQGTNLCSERPLDIFTSEEHLSNALGNACIVKTSDDMYIFLVRSQAVGEGEGRSVLPGGHAEPSRIGVDTIPERMPAVSQSEVVRELYSSAIEEVVEEVGIPLADLVESEHKMLGIVRRTMDLKAQTVSLVQARQSSNQVGSLWQAKGECSQIHFLSAAELTTSAQTGRVGSVSLMPEHHAAVVLYVEHFLAREIS